MSSITSSSNSVYLQPKTRPVTMAMISNLPRHLNTDRALWNVLKDFPQVKYSSISVKVNGLAFIKSTDTDIVNKLKVLKELYGQKVQISEYVPKWVIEKEQKELEKQKKWEMEQEKKRQDWEMEKLRRRLEKEAIRKEEQEKREGERNLKKIQWEERKNINRKKKNQNTKQVNEIKTNLKNDNNKKDILQKHDNNDEKVIKNVEDKNENTKIVNSNKKGKQIQNK